MKTFILNILVLGMLFSSLGYADPSNVVYNNGPTSSDSGAGVAMERLRATEKDLDKMTFERNIAVREMNFRIERDESRISPVVWTVVGILAGGAAGYFGARAVSK